MNFPDYNCDNAEIGELLSYLPITTPDDYPWMQKYIDDLLLHEEKGEYELAVISAHMIYMFIIYCFILKNKEFKLNLIQCDFQNDKENCPKSQNEINPYLYAYKSDKKCFSCFRLDKELKALHDKIVHTRDQIAHCTGNTLSENDFTVYIQRCTQSIKNVYNIIFEKFKKTDTFQEAINQGADYDDVIKDFLLSPTELQEILEFEIQNKIIERLSDINSWQTMLDNTIPANYGLNDYDIQVEELDLDMFTLDEYIEGTFETTISMNFVFQMASSNSDDGYEENYDNTFTLEGNWAYNLISRTLSIELNTMPSIELY